MVERVEIRESKGEKHAWVVFFCCYSRSLHPHRASGSALSRERERESSGLTQSEKGLQESTASARAAVPRASSLHLFSCFVVGLRWLAVVTEMKVKDGQQRYSWSLHSRASTHVPPLTSRCLFIFSSFSPLPPILTHHPVRRQLGRSRLRISRCRAAHSFATDCEKSTWMRQSSMSAWSIF